ncbi:MAG: ATPase [Actinomycetia bacterium]|nr:ATPase [Actinomycetes bacterium]
MTTPLVLGADCGGTASRAVLATASGQILGRGLAGAGNPVARDPDQAAGALAAAVGQALGGHDPALVQAAVAGMAGEARLADPAAAAVYQQHWSALGLRCPLRTVPDTVVGFAAGTPEPAGTVLIAGTGAVAAEIAEWDIGRTADGLGWLLGDEGSGFWLGLQAARYTARALQHGAELSPLASEVALRIGGSGLEDFVTRVYQLPRTAIGAFATSVTACAQAGDPVAIALLADAADRLAATLISLGPPPGPVVLAGGLLTGVPEIRDRVQDAIAGPLGDSGTVASDGAAAAAWLAALPFLADPPGVHAVLVGKA